MSRIHPHAQATGVNGVCETRSDSAATSAELTRLCIATVCNRVVSRLGFGLSTKSCWDRDGACAMDCRCWLPFVARAASPARRPHKA